MATNVISTPQTGPWVHVRIDRASDDSDFPSIDGSELIELGNYDKAEIQLVLSSGITSVTIESACPSADGNGWISNNDAITKTESCRLKAESLFGHKKFTTKLSGIVGAGTVDVYIRGVNV